MTETKGVTGIQRSWKNTFTKRLRRVFDSKERNIGSDSKHSTTPIPRHERAQRNTTRIILDNIVRDYLLLYKVYMIAQPGKTDGRSLSVECQHSGQTIRHE